MYYLHCKTRCQIKHFGTIVMLAHWPRNNKNNNITTTTLQQHYNNNNKTTTRITTIAITLSITAPFVWVRNRDLQSAKGRFYLLKSYKIYATIMFLFSTRALISCRCAFVYMDIWTINTITPKWINIGWQFCFRCNNNWRTSVIGLTIPEMIMK